MKKSDEKNQMSTLSQTISWFLPFNSALSELPLHYDFSLEINMNKDDEFYSKTGKV